MRFAAAAGIVGALSLALAWSGMPVGRADYVPRALPRELHDLGVACLASGEVRPAVSELSDAELAAIVEIIARLIGAYERADFDSFLALRAGDLESATERRSRDLESLRTIAQEMAIPPEKLRGDWIGVLASFWGAYYDRPPITRFLPEETRIARRPTGAEWRSLPRIRDPLHLRKGGPLRRDLHGRDCEVHRCEVHPRIPGRARMQL